MELFEAIKTQDTIAFFNSEFEKKFITISIIDHFSFELKNDCLKSLKRSVILVPDPSLFEKQALAIQNHTDLKVGIFSSFTSDSFNDDHWKNQFISNEVILMTCSLLNDLLSKTLITFAQINLLILNDAHLVLQSSCYKKLAHSFSTLKIAKPRLVAFVPSLIESKHSSKVIDSVIKKLENTFGATRNTSLNLNLFCKGEDKTKCEIEFYKENPFPLLNSNLSSIKMIENFIDFVNKCSEHFSNQTITNLSRIKESFVEIFEIMKQMGYWCAEKLTNIYTQECAELSFKIGSFNPLLSHLLSSEMSLLYYFNKSLREIYFSPFNPLTDYISGRMKIILKVLNKFRPSLDIENESNKQVNLCGIIFAKRRSVVRLLHLWIESQVEFHDFLKVDYLIGNRSKCSLSSSLLSMTTKHQKEALARFKKHETNLLIATANLESVLDIAKCNLVIKYDFPEDFSGYLYSKNRVRAEKGLYILMIPLTKDEKVNPFMENLKEYYKKENLLRNINGKMKVEIESETSLDINEDDLVSPYLSTDDPNGPKASLSSSLLILNRYCLKLPSDSFTKLTPQFKFFTNQDNLIQCTIFLPINSPLREPVLGQFMPTENLSMKSAALEACKKLHKMNELNNDFLPYGKESNKYIAELGLEMYKTRNEMQTKRFNDSIKLGTIKRRQCFNKRIAKALQGPIPNSKQTCNLYAFTLDLTCPIPEEQNTRGRKLFIPSQTDRSFAFLTCHFVPKICDFPLFIRSGEVMVSMKEIAKNLLFSEKELERISNFHHFVFHDLLCLDKNPMMYDPSNAKSAYYILPVNLCSTLNEFTKETLIDWDFMEKVALYEKEDKVRDNFKRSNEPFVFKKEIYEDAVVKPWYRQYEVQAHYYVADICYDMTPQNSFPDEVHDTFVSYYQQKYNIVLSNLDQPLLDVDHTSARLNLLTSRFVNRKGVTLPISSQKTKKDKRENLQQKQLLIPELCIVHPFSASLWRKAVCIPCILYRVNSLLVAEELRQEVAKSIGIGPVTLPPDQNWPPLDFGWTLSQVVAQSNLKKKKLEKDFFSDEHSLLKPNFQDDNNDKNYDEKMKNENNENIENNEDCLIIDEFDLSLCQTNDFSSLKEIKIEDWSDSAFDIYSFEKNFPQIKTNSYEISSSLLIDAPLMEWSFYKENGIQIRELDDYEDTDLKPVKFGSPNNYEGWDVNRKRLNTVYDIGIPGLTSISAPKTLNLQGLSKDLANFKKFSILNEYENEENFPDDFDLDDEAAEFDPYIISYSKENGKNEANQSKNEEFYNEIIECGLIVPILDCSSQHETFLDNIDIALLELEKNENNEDEKKVLQQFEKKFKINSFEDKYKTVYPAVKANLDIDQVINKLKKMVQNDFENNVNIESPLETKKVKQEITQMPSMSNNFNKPTFGELLPNRDEVILEPEEVNTTITFDIYQDEKLIQGPSPSIILQALTMSNAGDGINLERLETVGDSFLKYAVTVYNYSMCPDVHEGRLSFLRSLQISNHNLYCLGREKNLGELMISTKFEPKDNWLPPGFTITEGSEQALIEASGDNKTNGKSKQPNEIYKDEDENEDDDEDDDDFQKNIENELSEKKDKCNLFYSLVTQHFIPDKSIADAVEALIGAYLIYSGQRGALLFMKWLGLKVMPDSVDFNQQQNENFNANKLSSWLPKIKSPLLFPHQQDELMKLYQSYGLNRFEKEIIKYEFKDKSFLIQAFTHNSYFDNKITECYQRLEFLGDAVLDFLITRHLYDDPQQYSPGILTDLRSALVNNTFFASLAVKYEFHKHIKILAQDLIRVNSKFVEKFTANGFNKCNLLMNEDECEQLEDIEVPKALGDIFESVAGAIFLDSGLSLDSVWKVYYKMMKPELEYFSKNIPKSPVRELLELKPQKVLFSKPESVVGRKVRVICEVFGEGKYIGIGRNKRLAKSTAAKKALRDLKIKQDI